MPRISFSTVVKLKRDSLSEYDMSVRKISVAEYDSSEDE